MHPNSSPHVKNDAVRLRRREPTDVSIASAVRSRERETLSFIGLEKTLDAGIDWRALEMPRLWRYHLHYFDYLQDNFRTQPWKKHMIDDWIVSNPPRTAVAWEPYPASLRIVNWIKFFDRLRRDGTTIELSWLDSLYGQVLWLERNLERHVLANHLLKNAKALMFAGIFFDGIDATRWYECGSALFESQLQEQFLSDGGHFERSPMYHVLCVEDVLDVISIGSSSPTVSENLSEALRRCAVAGLGFLDAILMPDGEIPLFNDAAFDMASAPLALFDYAKRVIDYDRPIRLPGLHGVALSATGYYVIRDHADMLIVDCGEIGPQYQPGHAHCDMLSFELSLAGERFIVDSGVFNYEAGPIRRHIRSTAAHNTVCVDGREQSEVWGVFRVGRRARPIAARLFYGPSGALCFDGAHDGFHRIDAILHRRTITYSGGLWLVTDVIEGSGVHRIESRIQLAPQLTTVLDGNRLAIVDANGSLRGTIHVENLRGCAIKLEEGPYYPRFGVTEMRSVIVLSVQCALPVILAYTILPADHRAA